MKKNEIKVGGLYLAKISNRIVTVRVDAIREVFSPKRNNYSGLMSETSRDVYDVTNLTTGRKTTFKSAAKFRGVAPAAKPKLMNYQEKEIKRVCDFPPNAVFVADSSLVHANAEMTIRDLSWNDIEAELMKEERIKTTEEFYSEVSRIARGM